MAKIIKILASASATWWREGNFNKIIINIIGNNKIKFIKILSIFSVVIEVISSSSFVSVIGVGCRRVDKIYLLFFSYF